ncbi:hypothetical protein SPAN111604_14200 [Sphingomonas antarctica]
MTKTPIAMLGIDLGKNSCSLAGMDASGAVILRRRMTREGLIKFAAELPPCIVAMEACCGAHYLGRTFEAQGHTVRLMSPEYVAPYVKAQKTDDRDAEAIAEAATRPTMRLVTLKTEAQLDLQVLHRARERLVAGRTRLTNQLRAVLLERGVILPKRRSCLAKRLDEMMKEGELAVSPRAIRLLQDLREEWASLDRRITAYDDELAALIRRRWKKRHKPATLTPIPCPASSVRRSASVMSDFFSKAPRITAACASIRAERRSPPCCLGVASPTSFESACQRIPLDALTPNRAAAWRHDAPASIAAITRRRRSIDSALAIHPGLPAGMKLESDRHRFGNPC